MKPPTGLQKPGRDLWRWIVEQGDIDGCEPMVNELCRLQDRLHQVRESISSEGVWLDGKKNPLVDVEMKVSGQFAKVWRLLGLADRDEAPKRPPGRPPDSERFAR